MGRASSKKRARRAALEKPLGLFVPTLNCIIVDKEVIAHYKCPTRNYLAVCVHEIVHKLQWNLYYQYREIEEWNSSQEDGSLEALPMVVEKIVRFFLGIPDLIPNKKGGEYYENGKLWFRRKR
jgi:hypothetical protein